MGLSLRAWSAALLIGAAGCAAEVTDEGPEGEVQAQAEALNFGPDFQVGVVAIKYVDGQTLPIKSEDGWTLPLSSGSSASAVTLFKNGELDPTGPRVALYNFGEGTLPTMATDFRVVLQAWDTSRADRLGPAMTTSTRWASEGGGIDWNAFTGQTFVFAEDRYQIRLETRPWPQNVTKTLVDFRIGVAMCGSFTPGGVSCLGSNYTLWAGQLQVGAKSWSQTVDTTQPRAFPQIDLNVILQ